ncbi:MAG: hypothetical protein QOJ12_529 [Thermoleophilales bacterium]|nr:hypothetical protein [Thermoleophilales bacterium]
MALGAASPALAAGDWLPAQKITEADRSVPRVGMFGDGETVAAWSTGYLTAGSPETLTHLAGTPFGPAQPLSSEVGKGPVLALNEAGAAAVAWHAVNSYEAQGWISLRTPGGAFGEPRDLNHFFNQLGIDRDGNTYALLSHSVDSATRQLEVATVPADGSATITRVIGQAPDFLGPSMTVDPAGTVTVAWRAIREGETYANTHVYVATAARGGDFGEPVIVSGAYQDNNLSGQATRVVSNARGDVLVLWPALDQSESSPTASDQTIRGAFRPAGGSFGSEEQVPMPDARSRGTFSWDAAMGKDGDAVVAWSSLRNVSMTYRPASGPFEPAWIPPPYPVCCEQPPVAQVDPSVAFDGTGNAAVAYRGAHRVEVVRRPRLSEGFLAPQSAGESLDNFDPDIAFDRIGRGIVMWAAQEEWGSDDSKTDHGIYAAEYDPNAPPRLTRIVVRSKRRLGLEATEQGRATFTVRRKGTRKGKPVLVKHPRVVPGYNPVELTKAERRRLAQKARYVAVATFTDGSGHTSNVATATFRSR